MMPAKTRIPAFQSEKEEAAWWDAHPEVVTALFLKAKKEGKIKRLPVIRGATRSTTIRLPIADIEAAQQIAKRRGVCDTEVADRSGSFFGLCAGFCSDPHFTRSS
jgi:hypothetical protein